MAPASVGHRAREAGIDLGEALEDSDSGQWSVRYPGGLAWKSLDIPGRWASWGD